MRLSHMPTPALLVYVNSALGAIVNMGSRFFTTDRTVHRLSSLLAPLPLPSSVSFHAESHVDWVVTNSFALGSLVLEAVASLGLNSSSKVTYPKVKEGLCDSTMCFPQHSA